MKKIVLVFLLTLGFFSCNSNGLIKIDNTDLVGKWNWLATSGGIANQINETPTTTGKNIELKLQKNHDYSIIENGIEIMSGTYDLSMKKSIYSGKMERFIKCSVNKPLQNVIVSGIIKIYESNRLNISDNFFDGIGSDFEKTQ